MILEKNIINYFVSFSCFKRKNIFVLELKPLRKCIGEVHVYLQQKIITIKAMNSANECLFSSDSIMSKKEINNTCR